MLGVLTCLWNFALIYGLLGKLKFIWNNGFGTKNMFGFSKEFGFGSISWHSNTSISLEISNDNLIHVTLICLYTDTILVNKVEKDRWRGNQNLFVLFGQYIQENGYYSDSEDGLCNLTCGATCCPFTLNICNLTLYRLKEYICLKFICALRNQKH